MSDTVKHSDDEEIVTLTYTWGQVKNSRLRKDAQ